MFHVPPPTLCAVTSDKCIIRCGPPILSLNARLSCSNPNTQRSTHRSDVKAQTEGSEVRRSPCKRVIPALVFILRADDLEMAIKSKGQTI